MKVKVIEVFRDKYTNEVYKLDQELEVDKNRFKEIEKYVKEIKTSKESTKENTKESK